MLAPRGVRTARRQCAGTALSQALKGKLSWPREGCGEGRSPFLQPILLLFGSDGHIGKRQRWRRPKLWFMVRVRAIA